MERYLLVSGHILSFVLVAAGTLVLVLLLTSLIAVNAVAVVPEFGQNLVQQNVLDDLPAAVWQSVTDAVPPEVQIRGLTIQTQPLVSALGNSLRDIIASDLPLGQWLEAQARGVVASITDDLRGRAATTLAGGVDTLQQALSGTAAGPLANVVLASLEQCTDAQTQQLQQLLGTSPSPALSVGVSFLCRPPESLGVPATDLMRNTLTVVLAEIGAQVGGEVERRLAAIDLPTLSVDSPIGQLTLEWPDVRIGSGFLSVTVPLPENIVAAVEEAVGNISAGLFSGIEQVQTTIVTPAAEARATADAAGAQIATGIATRIPPTAEPTVTLVPAPTLPATLTPEEITAQREAVSPLEQRVLDITLAVSEAVAPAAGQLTLILLLVIGLPLLLHDYIQIYMLRTLRLWFLWLALMATASGLTLLWMNGRLTARLVEPLTPTGASSLPAPIAAVGGEAMAALQSALQSVVNAPFVTWAILLLVPGLIGLAVLGLAEYRRRKA